jgi:hypothetical protein
MLSNIMLSRLCTNYVVLVLLIMEYRTKHAVHLLDENEEGIRNIYHAFHSERQRRLSHAFDGTNKKLPPTIFE